MSDVFISYARATERQAAAIADLLRARGVAIWRDDEIPPHRPFGDVIQERLEASKAVLVLWSADATTSHWVRAEAEYARSAGKLVQLTLDGAPLPLPFPQVQCAQMVGWAGDPDHPALARVLASVDALVAGPTAPEPAPTPVTPPNPNSVRVQAVPPAGPAADALAEDVAMTLAKAPGLILKEAGETAWVLEVGAREAGGRVRATARLLSSPDGRQHWNARFDGQSDDLFRLSDQLSEAAAASVEAHVRRARLATAAALPPATPEGLVLAASAAINRMEAAGFYEALDLLARALEAAVPRADAHALAALAHASLYVNGHPGSSAANHAQGIEQARKALRLTDSQAFPVGLAAVVLAWLGEPVAPSLALVERVLALTPGFAPALLWQGQVKLVAGDLPGAIAALEGARRLDPTMAVRPILLGVLGGAHMLSGALPEAEALLLEAVQCCPAIPMNNLLLAATHGLAGELGAGRAVLEAARAIAPPADFRLPLVPAHRALFADGLARLEG